MFEDFCMMIVIWTNFCMVGRKTGCVLYWFCSCLWCWM